MNFEIRIPSRAPLQPIARFKITLELSAAPGASTLDIFGQVGLGYGAPIPGLDDTVLFSAGPGNRVVIDVTLDSDFNIGDYWTLLPAAVRPRNIPIGFNPPAGVAVTGYRLSSYCAPSSHARGCPNRRVNNNPPTWVTAPPGANLGRHPIDIVLVLDRSGSMSMGVPAELPGAYPDPKMTLLQWAVSQFIDQWTLEATGHPDDRLAVVWFETTAVVTNPFVKRSLAGGWAAIEAAVNAQTTAGMTALGDGLTQAFHLWRSSPVADRNDLSILLMTNGMQNQGNLVLPNAIGDLTFFDQDAAGGAGATVTLASKCTVVQGVGVGATGTYMANLINIIADQTGGSSNINYGSEMDIAFTGMLVEIMKGNTLAIRLQVTQTIPEGTPASGPHTFELGAFARQAIILLAWRGTRFGLRMSVRDPDGSEKTAVRAVNNPFYQIYTVDEATINAHPGDWQVIVLRSEAQRTVEYHLTVLLVEANLGYSLYFDNQDPTPGEPIILHADLSVDGLPLTGLPPNAIQVEVLTPPGAMGTVLHNTNVPDSVLETNPPGSDPDGFNTPGDRKINHLIRTADLGKIITPVQSVTGQLLDDGASTSGDQAKDDGTYSFRFTQTRVPGLYRFRVRMEIDTPQTGKVRRFEERQVDVRIQEPAPASLWAEPGKEAGTFLIHSELVDRFGNYLGPDHQLQFALQVTGGGTLNFPLHDPRAKGDYTVSLTGVPLGADPRVSLSFEGRPVRSDPVSKLVKGTGCPWLIIGLLVELIKRLLDLLKKKT